MLLTNEERLYVIQNLKNNENELKIRLLSENYIFSSEEEEIINKILSKRKSSKSRETSGGKKIHTGKRGGKYILVNGKKRYL